MVKDLVVCVSHVCIPPSERLLDHSYQEPFNSTASPFSIYVISKTHHLTCPVFCLGLILSLVQKVKDLSLPQLQHRLQLQLRNYLWPWIFHVPWVWEKTFKSLLWCNISPSSILWWPKPKFPPFLHCIMATLGFGWCSHSPWSVVYHLFCPLFPQGFFSCVSHVCIPTSDRLLDHSYQEPLNSTASPFPIYVISKTHHLTCPIFCLILVSAILFSSQHEDMDFFLVLGNLPQPKHNFIYQLWGNVIYLIIFPYIFLNKTASAIYGSSQAKGWIGAAALAYAKATATPDLSCICGLWCTLWQCCILNPLSKARYFFFFPLYSKGRPGI